MKALSGIPPTPTVSQLAALPVPDLKLSPPDPPPPPPDWTVDNRRNKRLSRSHPVNLGKPVECKRCGAYTTNYDPTRYTMCYPCSRESTNRRLKKHRKKEKKKRDRAKREAERKRQERARVKALQARLLEVDPGSALKEFRDALAFQFPDPDFFARQIVDLVNDSGSKRARFRAMCLIARLIDETGGVERYRDAAGTMAEQYGGG